MNEQVMSGLNVYVEGNIASGKSTLLQNFELINNNIEIFPEPLDRWQNVNGENLFELYHKDPEKFAFPFQSYVMLTMLQRQLEEPKKPIRLFERSLLGASLCFIEALLETDKIDTTMATILKKWYEFLHTNFDPEIDLIIYVKTSPTKAYQRLQHRGRSEERNISMAYLSVIHAHYERWLNTQNKYKVIVVNGELDVCKMKQEYERCLRSIEGMLTNKQEYASINEKLSKMMTEYAESE